MNERIADTAVDGDAVAPGAPGYVAPAYAAAIGAPGYTETMPRLPESAAAARRLVITVLEVWRLGELAEAAALVVTELVSNATEHARGDVIGVTITRSAERRVRIAVADKAHVEPIRHDVNSGDERGRGLALIDAVSVARGADLMPWGKRVWADLSAETDCS